MHAQLSARNASCSCHSLLTCSPKTTAAGQAHEAPLSTHQGRSAGPAPLRINKLRALASQRGAQSTIGCLEPLFEGEASQVFRAGGTLGVPGQQVQATERSNKQILTPLNWFDIAIVAILTGVSEELLFRGAIIPGSFLDWWVGVLHELRVCIGLQELQNKPKEAHHASKEIV
eukprot:1152198-Pelagomonas_calceolata.AAC.4